MNEKEVDRIMAYMTLARFERTKEGQGHEKIPLSNFSGALSLLDNSGIGIEENRPVSISGASLNDVRDINVDFSFIQPALIEVDADKGSMWQVMRYKALGLKEKRGWPLSHLPTMQADICYVRENGQYDTARTHFIKHNNTWKMYFPYNSENPLGSKDMDDKRTWDENIGVALGMLFCNEFYWTAEIGYQDNPSVKFHCTPEGSRELFRLRDVPEGKQRRTAIKHWVQTHSRIKSNYDESITIQKYLRGEMNFVWNGLKCIIRPSPSDLREYYRLHPKSA